ncbi:MAG: DUF3311 domain-containing protein [Nocardioidaceae bacterium]
MAKSAPNKTDPAQRAADPAGNPDWNPWVLLLIIPVALPLIPQVFNRVQPALFGMPAFYWIQLAYVLMSACLTGVVYLKSRKRR